MNEQADSNVLPFSPMPAPKGQTLPHLHAVMEVARCAHEVVRGYREAIGDGTCPPWDETDQEERQAAAHRVIEVLKKKHLSMGELHHEWCDSMREQGWVTGETLDIENKRHNLLVPYDQLPEANRIEDAVFRNTVLAMFY